MCNYIVFDLEFNQDLTAQPITVNGNTIYPFEIIQIGAIKLDSEFQTLKTYNRYVRPTIYTNISSFITELTGITTEQLANEETFKEVYTDFESFIGTDDIFCIWGRSDIKELYQSANYYNLYPSLPKRYIDLQPYASLYLNQQKNKLLRLQHAVEKMDIPMPFPFHNALHDAYYTAEILKKLCKLPFQLKYYNPEQTLPDKKSRTPKSSIDFDALIRQFEKMYRRSIITEEQDIIKLAYQMGKTGQFLKHL